MAVIGDLVARLTADTRGFDRNLTKSRGTLVSFADIAKGAAVTAAGAFGVASIGAFAQKAISAAANFESAGVSFEVLTGSAEKAQQVMGDLSDFAASTPFEMNELQSASTKLLAFGTSADDLIPTLQRIGDISSGIGAPIAEIAELYGKAKVQGRLFGEDINQLTGRGIPIIGELAKQFGVADSEVKKLVESGKVNFTHLEKAFQSLAGEGGKFGGMMEKQSQTLSGKWSTLQDSITGLAREFGNVLLPAGKNFLDSMITGLDSLTAKVREWGDTAGFVFRNFSDIAQVAMIDLQLAIYDLIPGSESVFAEIAGFLVATWDGGRAAFDVFVQNVVAGFQEIVQVAQAVGAGVKAALAAAFAGENPATAFTDAFMATFANQQDIQGAGNPLEKFTEEFNKTREAVREGFASGGGLGDELRQERQRLLDQIGQRETAAMAQRETAAAQAAEGEAKSPGVTTPKLAAAMEQFSVDALSTINKASAGGQKEPIQQVADTAAKQLETERKIEQKLASIERNMGRPVVFAV